MSVTLSIYSRERGVRSEAWKMYPGETGIEDATCRVRPPLKKCFFVVDEGEFELLGEGCSRRVVHRGAEGHEDRVAFERED